MLNMKLSATNNVRITFDQLDGLLTTLGFERRDIDQAIIYREAVHDAMIILPHLDRDSEVGNPYLVTVFRTVTGKGIISEDEFQARLGDILDSPHTRKSSLATYKRSRTVTSVATKSQAVKKTAAKA